MCSCCYGEVGKKAFKSDIQDLLHLRKGHNIQLEVNRCVFFAYQMLEKTKRTIKTGHSRNTDNIGHRMQNEGQKKTTKKHNTEN